MRFLFLYSAFLISLGGWAQSNLKYSGFFDSYYTTGPLKYYVEPGMTMMNGELENNRLSYGIGGGVNYRILPPIYLNGSVRYLDLRSSDHDASRNSSFSGNRLQLNVIGNYHFVYDRIRTSADRRRGPKKVNAYASFGLAFNLRYTVKPTAGNAGQYSTNVYGDESGTILNFFTKPYQTLHFPVGLGMPIRVTPRFTVVPEIQTYLTAVIPFIQTGSDRLDGLEYTGDARQPNDAYTFFSVKFMFNPKGKRLKPKRIEASNGRSLDGGGSSSGDDDFDSFDDTDEGGGDDFFTPFEEEETDDTPADEETDEFDETEEDTFEEETDDAEDDGFFEDEGDGFEEETEDDGPQYDEDGFLIDE